MTCVTGLLGIVAMQQQSLLTYNISVIYVPRFSCIGGVDSVDRVLQAITFVYVLQDEEEASWGLLLLLFTCCCSETR